MNFSLRKKKSAYVNCNSSKITIIYIISLKLMPM